MFVSYFTEQPYSAFKDDTSFEPFAGDHPFRRPSDNNLIFSNRFFDPVKGSRLYGERIEEHQLAEEVGFDGITFKRAPQRGLLHAAALQHDGGGDGGQDLAGQDRAAGPSAADLGKPGPTGGGSRHAGHDFQGPHGAGDRARRRGSNS